MNRSKIIQIASSIILCLIGAQAKAQLDVPIDKGVIKGNLEITLVDKNVTLKPNEEFSLSQLGLNAQKNKFNNDIGRVYMWSEKFLKDGWKYGSGVPFYKIKIHRLSDNSVYYGLIMFYNTDKKHTDYAVCQSYELSIGDDVFDAAKDGHIAYCYEKYMNHELGTDVEYPTWVIYFSDTQTGFSDKK